MRKKLGSLTYDFQTVRIYHCKLLLYHLPTFNTALITSSFKLFPIISSLNSITNAYPWPERDSSRKPVVWDRFWCEQCTQHGLETPCMADEHAVESLLLRCGTHLTLSRYCSLEIKEIL